jgi:hypothetical protein
LFVIPEGNLLLPLPLLFVIPAGNLLLPLPLLFVIPAGNLLLPLPLLLVIPAGNLLGAPHLASEMWASDQPPQPITAAAPTLHVYSRETIVDVTVTDSKGNPVRGLTRSDFASVLTSAALPNSLCPLLSSVFSVVCSVPTQPQAPFSASIS